MNKQEFLLVLGAPIWLSLLIAAFAVAFSLYVLLWSVIVSLWAVFVSLAACTLGGIAVGIVFVLNGSVATGIAMIGAAVICAGLFIFLFFGCRAITKGTCRLTKKLLCRIFRKKEEA